jgi:hypothetical protein
VAHERSDSPNRIPWWLYPNLVALDAPLVAVVWQRFLASRFGVPLHFPISATLALAVWSIYLLDRWWDARRGEDRTERHRWAGAHRALLLRLVVVSLAAVLVAIGFLPSAVVETGAVVAAGIAGYLALVHLLSPGTVAKTGFKELLVGIGFAAGVAVPLLASPTFRYGWLMAVAAFGGLCWLNCRLIERWESRTPGLGWNRPLILAILLTSAATPRPVALALNGSLALLVAVHFGLRGRPRAARVLADAVLILPLAVEAAL